MRHRTSSILALLMLNLPIRGHAQAVAPRDVCFRGRPLAKCQSWIELELGTGIWAAGTSSLRRVSPGFAGFRDRDLGSYLSGSLGYMRNRDATHALGVLLSAGGGESGGRYALQVRRRTWIAPLSFDTDIGLLTTQQLDVGGHFGTTQAYGVTVGSAVMAGDLIGVSLSADVARARGHTGVGLHAGWRSGSWLAAVSIAAIGVIAAAFSGQDF